MFWVAHRAFILKLRRDGDDFTVAAAGYYCRRPRPKAEFQSDVHHQLRRIEGMEVQAISCSILRVQFAWMRTLQPTRDLC